MTVPAAHASATFAKLWLDEGGEDRQENDQCGKDRRSQAAGETTWDQLPADADDHPPMEDDMEHEQEQEHQA